MDDKVYTALGLMSGTSLDGVDVAIIKTDGVDIFEFGDSAEVPYVDFEREVLERAVKDALEWGFDKTSPPPSSFSEVESIINSSHLRAVRKVQEEYSHHGNRRVYPGLSIIGFHGQTVLHHPAVNGDKGQTLQLGDGKAFADITVSRVAYDFRSNDVSLGGQGAPLAPIYHEALVRYSKMKGKVAVVNIGGVSNASFIEDGALVGATDCGPGNGPLDSWVSLHGKGRYDIDGRLSFAGEVHHDHIKQWLNRDFFTRPSPRSADRYDFDVLDTMMDFSVENGAATLASFCAQTIARDLSNFEADRVIVCGGGRKNPAIMAMLDIHTDAEVATAEDVGWDGDMLEAQAFAYLAVRSWKGLPISFPRTTCAPHPLTGGQIAYPEKSLYEAVYGSEGLGSAKVNWPGVKMKLEDNIIDDKVTNAMSLPEDEVPPQVNLYAYRRLYLPLYLDYARGRGDAASNKWEDKFGSQDPEEVWLDIFGTA